MPTPIPSAAMSAVTDRLQLQLTDVTVERDRRAPVDVDTEALPRLVVALDGIEADTAQEPGVTHYTLAFTVVGYASGEEDTGAALALHTLHARVVAALAGWTPDTAGLGDLAELGADFALYDADQSAAPAGDFAARFSMLATATTGNPYL